MHDSARSWWAVVQRSACFAFLSRISTATWQNLLLSLVAAAVTLATLVCLWNYPRPTVHTVLYCCTMEAGHFCITLPLDAEKNRAGEFYTKLPKKLSFADGAWECALYGFIVRHAWPDLRHVRYGQWIDIKLDGGDHLMLSVNDFGDFTAEDLDQAIRKSLDYAIEVYKGKPYGVPHGLYTPTTTTASPKTRCMEDAVSAWRKQPSQTKAELQERISECERVHTTSPEPRNEKKRSKRRAFTRLFRRGNDSTEVGSPSYRADDMGYYEYHSDELIEIMKSLSITYVPEIRRFTFNSSHPSVLGIEISRGLAYAMGFPTEDLIQKGGISKWDPAQYISDIAIFADFVEPSIVGENLEPLLDVVSVDGAVSKYRTKIERTFGVPNFCRIGVRELNEIRLSLRTINGKPIPNLTDTIICKLLFRQLSVD